jgi:quercetin dioxygenase-like cupin family protein
VLLAAGDTFTTPRGAARAFRATSSEGAMVFVVRGGEETAPARFLTGKAA